MYACMHVNIYIYICIHIYDMKPLGKSPWFDSQVDGGRVAGSRSGVRTRAIRSGGAASPELPSILLVVKKDMPKPPKDLLFRNWSL